MSTGFGGELPIVRRAASSSACRTTAARIAGTTSLSRKGLTRYAKTPAEMALSTVARSAYAVSITIGIGVSA